MKLIREKLIFADFFDLHLIQSDFFYFVKFKPDFLSEKIPNFSPLFA